MEDPTGLRDTGHVTLDITCVPDGPVAVDDAVTVTEDASAVALDVLANDSDADGDALHPAIATQPLHGTAQVVADVVRYTPDANYCNTPPGTSPDTFTYRLDPLEPAATVSVAVTCVDDPPVAVNDSYLLDEDDAATPLDVLANDTDVDGGAIAVDEITQPAHGDVVVTGGGTGLSYVPDANYCNTPPGTDPETFTYTLAPGGSTATVSVAVTCVVDAAVAHDDTVTVAEDASATTVDVLGNDEPGDGGAPSVTAVTSPAHGTAALAGGVVTYQPDANYCNVAPDVDTFDYTLSGGSSATVSVAVTCVNDAPTATDVAFSGANAAIGNTTLVIDDSTDGPPSVVRPHKTVGGDLLGGASDVETPASLAIVAESVTTAHGGTAVIETDGDITYTPPAGCSTTPDTFSHTVTDGDATGQAQVSIASTGCVWYVDSAGPGNDGTSAAPFDTLAQAVTAGSANDVIHVVRGTGASYDAAVVLKPGQRLVGGAADLVVASTSLAIGAPAERPTLTRSGATSSPSPPATP
ncbi:tandem-95 repeat protein [Nocardioides sp. W3-2-3]|nr:tandem-95 repeat protein [Nocardioides convexus]